MASSVWGQPRAVAEAVQGVTVPTTDQLCLGHMLSLRLWTGVALGRILFLEASAEHRKWGLSYRGDGAADAHSQLRSLPHVTVPWFTKQVPRASRDPPGGPRGHSYLCNNTKT